jgi:hypothetical protein
MCCNHVQRKLPSGTVLSEDFTRHADDVERSVAKSIASVIRGFASFGR